MNQIKIWTVLTFGWLCVFFTIERLHEPMNIASFVYVVTALLAIGILSLPRVSTAAQAGLVIGSFVILLVGKAWLGYPIGGTSFPITVTEAVALWVTIVLVCRVQKSLEQLGQTARRIALADSFAASQDFEQGQVQIYRDLRLARRNQRPLSLLTVAPRLSGSGHLPDRLIHEMVEKSTHQYLRGLMAQTLSKMTSGCATVVGRNDHLVVAMPEVDEQQGRMLIEQVRA
jgi:hypothetical protein